MANLELDWKEYKETAARMVSEGCVLLENNGVLPLKEKQCVSIFGRIQLKYYKSGTGSGGMVNVSHVVNIPEGLRNGGRVILNEDLYKIYEEWEEENPFDEGHGWGTEPWSQVEMPLTEDIVKDAKNKSDVALVILGRTAGEDRDIKCEEGAYLLSEDERMMISLVRKHFDKMVLVLNIASLMDISFIDEYKPDAILLVWTGGMVGGEGTARVLDGRVSPSARLTSTIAYKLEDYPSYDYYGDETRNFYAEDIFVGYRYFETFAKDKVRYPFGYGLSYTKFKTEVLGVTNENNKVELKVKVTNIGDAPAKHSVLVYVAAPTGKLGKAARVLGGFDKTETLANGENQILKIEVDYKTFASYDDLAKTGHQSAFVLEKGKYDFYIGGDIREAEQVYSFDLDEDLVLESYEKALLPQMPFDRFVATEEDGKYKLVKEQVPASDIDEEARREENLMEEIPYEDKGYKLKDLADGKCSLEDFVGQFTDDDLFAIVRGEGMGSSLVTPGTASAFGGVSESLRDKGLPCICCDDGPSGMRLDSGAKAFSLPSGTLIASSFNTKLTRNLYEYTSMEMCVNKVDCLLGPGMNINRHPLNGRNFEYFSEDPFVTGAMGTAMLQGLSKYGNFGTVKHFCANNQEYKRLYVDAVVSERALREIYLKGFEMAVKSGACHSVMTTYGSVNGLWTASNFDLTYTILRKQWGFEGVVMTDWWADMNRRGKEQCKTDFAAMVRANNDLYMVVPKGENFDYKENTKEELESGYIEKSELQRIAIDVTKFALTTQAFARLVEKANKVTIINMDEEEEQIDMSNLEYISFVDDVTVDLTYQESKAGTDYIIPLQIEHTGFYDITLTASSNLSEVAQLPATLYYTGVPFLTYTYNGTKGEDVDITKRLYCHNKMAVLRLNVAKNGLDIKKIRFQYVEGERPKREF